MRVCPACELETESDRCPKDGRTTVEASKLRVSQSADPLIGKTLEGKYVLESRLGRGGFGAVYLGRHAMTGGKVAVKVLRADMVEDESAIRRFYIEAQNTHGLTHPNTVRVADFGQTADGMLFLAMEHVGGEPLSAVLGREKHLSAMRTVRVVEQILKSLAEAHGKGIVHRDIKPANVMLLDQVGEPDFVKVLDFGISRSLDSTGASTRGALGTPRYMAPEQWRGEGVGPAADLYSVGCMAYEMLAGKSPFVISGSGTDQAMRYMAAHAKEMPVPLGSDVCSKALADLIARLMEKRPTDRPASAEDVLRELAELRRRGAIEASPDEPQRRQGTLVLPVVTPEELGATLRLAPRGEAPMRANVPAVPTPAAASASGPRAPAPPEAPNPTHTGTAGLEIPLPRRRWSWVAIGAAVAIGAVATTAAVLSRPEAPAVETAAPAEDPQRMTAPSHARSRDSAKALSRTAEPPAPSASPPRPEPTVVAAAPPPPATLTLVTNPPGAAAAGPNGEVLGTTPLTVRSPPFGAELDVELQLAGHRTTHAALRFPAAGTAREESVKLAALPVLHVTSQPAGAEVRVKETALALGTTPTDWTVPETLIAGLAAGTSVTLVVTKGRQAIERALTAADVASAESRIEVMLPPAPRAAIPARPVKPVAPPSKGDGWQFK